MLDVYPQIKHMLEYENLKFEIIHIDNNEVTSTIYDDIFIEKLSDTEYGVYYDYTNEPDYEEEWYKRTFGENNDYITYKKRNKVDIIGKDGKLRARIGSISNFRDSNGAVNLSWLHRIFVEGRNSRSKPWDVLRWYPSEKISIAQYLFNYTKLHSGLINMIEKYVRNYAN